MLILLVPPNGLPKNNTPTYLCKRPAYLGMGDYQIQFPETGPMGRYALYTLTPLLELKWGIFYCVEQSWRYTSKWAHFAKSTQTSLLCKYPKRV